MQLVWPATHYSNTSTPNSLSGGVLDVCFHVMYPLILFHRPMADDFSTIKNAFWYEHTIADIILTLSIPKKTLTLFQKKLLLTSLQTVNNMNWWPSQSACSCVWMLTLLAMIFVSQRNGKQLLEPLYASLIVVRVLNTLIGENSVRGLKPGSQSM